MADVRCWHFSEVVVPKLDVRSWRKTGSSRPTTKKTRLTHNRNDGVKLTFTL